MSISLALLAAAGGGHAPPPLLDVDWTLLVQLGIFLLLYFVLRHTVFTPFLQMRRQRHDSVAGARARAEQLEKTSGERTTAYEQRLRAARKEASAERANRRAEAMTEAQQLLSGGRQQSDARLSEARARITSSVPAAELALRTRADQLARLIAAKVLGREL